MITLNAKKVAAVLSLTAALSITSSYAAEVRSISREVVTQQNGNSILTVNVTCAEVDDARTIVRASRSSKWCSKELATACHKQKMKAAQKVCGTHFEKQLKEYLLQTESDQHTRNSNDDVSHQSSGQSVNVAPSSSEDATIDSVPSDQNKPAEDDLAREMLELENQRLALEKERLDLRLKDLELKKRQLQALELGQDS